MRYLLRALGIVLTAMILSTCYAAATFNPAEAQTVSKQQALGHAYTVLNAKPILPDSLGIWIDQLSECTGQRPPEDWPPVILVVAEAIIRQEVMVGIDDIRMVRGVFLEPGDNSTGQPVVAIWLFDPNVRGTLMHELTHYVTGGMGHPAIDPLIARCVPDDS